MLSDQSAEVIVHRIVHFGGVLIAAAYPGGTTVLLAEIRG
jgi:hypothetical protein